MNPRAFLELAKRLLQSEPNPEGFRCAIGRAYYSAFNVASDFMINLKFSLRGDASDHELIYRWLNNCGDPQIKARADDLNTLRRLRNKADYKLTDQNSETRQPAEFAVALAGNLIASLDGCQGDFTRLNGIRIAITEYQKTCPT